MLHSSMSSKKQWTRLIKCLDPDFLPIDVDLYGYGQTAMPKDGSDFSLADEIDLVCAAIDQRIGKGEPFHLVGHSYGGAVALRLALEQQHRVVSLALYEPAAFHLLDHADPAHHEICGVVRRINEATVVDATAATRTFVDYWNCPGAFDAAPEHHQRAFVEQIGKVQLDFQALLLEPLQLTQLRQLAVPVCLMSGRDTTLAARRIATLLADTLPDVECHQIEAGHMGPITHADAVNRVLVSFLEQSLDHALAS